MKRELKILLIEDDTIELMKLNRAMLSLNMNHKVTEVNNGEDALELLLNEEYYPDIILLDLNMPKINGIEFLSILKTNESLKFIPTIILTTSSNKKDLLECYNIGIAGYVQKPLKYQDYIAKINILLSYWSANELIK
jgi:CheY-like chemotaxis protein|tara:strand:+ start:387 stop:797 length:411 start_codon:yes stop_codon:yes gene_type:complete